MSSLKKLSILILVAAFVFVLVSCGDNSASTEQPIVEEITVEAAPVPETEVQTVPAADTEVGSEIFIGSWKDIESEESFVNITKTDAEFTYEDNDGKYSATFQEGVLKVQVSDVEGDTADVYINSESGHLILSYQGSLSEYEKK